MDALKDKQKVSYGYNSRYASFYTSYNINDDKFVYGLTSRLKRDTAYILHNVSQGDTADSLAYKYYGRPDYYWIILDFNGINDSLVELWGNYKTIKVPSLAKIEFI